MLFKLYRITYSSKIPENTRFDDFQKFYEENGVTVVGGWVNVEKTNELFFMTGYKDEEHYNSFIAEMKENTRYQELTEQLSGDRESIDVTTLQSVSDIPSG
ncbi:MAG: hypothetical protein IH840_03330 [Candidatus Heimdallarchaeota archaeon]|nr:hypothetical protein [Candidatus Heimdallarchaeota archaeon]